MAESARIAIVGDPGVGKSSLMHLLCHGVPLPKSQHAFWSMGCSLDVKLHRQSHFIECVEIPGRSKHDASRRIFYPPIHGTLKQLWLFDDNCWCWMDEVMAGYNRFHSPGRDEFVLSLPTSPNLPASSLRRQSSFYSTPHPQAVSSGYLPNVSASSRNTSSMTAKNVVVPPASEFPVLVLGTKSDLASSRPPRKSCEIAEEYQGRWVDLCTRVPWEATAVPSAFLSHPERPQPESIVDAFLDEVLERKLNAKPQAG